MNSCYKFEINIPILNKEKINSIIINNDGFNILINDTNNLICFEKFFSGNDQLNPKEFNKELLKEMIKNNAIDTNEFVFAYNNKIFYSCMFEIQIEPTIKLENKDVKELLNDLKNELKESSSNSLKNNK